MTRFLRWLFLAFILGIICGTVSARPERKK